MTELRTKAELVNMLRETHRKVTEWFTAIPVDRFFARHGEVWSASDNMDHLIRSHKPITQTLKLPKIALQSIFGRPERASRPYEEICRIYRDELSRGAQASGRYLPNPQNLAAKAAEKKQELLDAWSRASTDLTAAAEKWQDRDLDLCQLPHPIIGKLTVREMLFFTIYHNLRHASQEGD